MVGKIRIIWLYHALVWSPRWVAGFSTTTMTRSWTSCGPKNFNRHHATAMTENDEAEDMTGDNKAMAFLRKMGKVGGASSEDLMNAIGVDEGPVGKTSRTLGGKSSTSVRKAKSAYQECTESGVIDDMQETFPFSSSGCQWTGYTDRVSGVSSGSISRETVDGRDANVLRGKVSLANNGGFVQMASDLALNPSLCKTVDASEYDGIKCDVYCDTENDSEEFNIQKEWTTINLPWSEFVGVGPGAFGTPFEPSSLRRIGVVAIGREMDVCLAVSNLGFYSVF
eukprot:scaffold2957_cov55-Attheya_sp.AAC.2